jgi:hypothetical protein
MKYLTATIASGDLKKTKTKSVFEFVTCNNDIRRGCTISKLVPATY